MKGLISEGEEYVKAKGDDSTVDAGLISAAQRVEHYEIAVYGTLRTYAEALGREDQARLLDQSLDEESAADEKLTDLAESGINAEALHSTVAVR
jgi:ferritin-like metal-binding protein YciE